MKNFKNYWKNLKYWKRGLYLSLLIYFLLNIGYLFWSILALGRITCPTFEGSICGDVVIVGYLIISTIWFFWYSILVGIPLTIIFWIIGLIKSKNDK